MFGAIGVLAALLQRQETGRGQDVQVGLFENNVLRVAQHMMQASVTGKAAVPMPSRVSAWAVYDVFTVRDGEQIFLAVVSDTQWAAFCDAFDFADLKSDARLATNNDRVRARDWLLPIVRERLATRTARELGAIFERRGLPYAPITRPQDLFDDPHLVATGGLASVTIPASASSAGRELEARTPLLPLALDGVRLPARCGPPALGQDNIEVLRALGYSDEDINALRTAGIVAESTAGTAHAKEATGG
jgi:crotonobetainyl-CoA:carnitine CoA-transferase CaiB-like acyl-CoA transferase